MEALKNWFAPLLWIFGTAGAIAAFVRLCTPAWELFKAPQELRQDLEQAIEKLYKRFDKVDKDMAQQTNDLQDLKAKYGRLDEVQLTLLHDQIRQIYVAAEKENYISTRNYERALTLYAQDGKDPTIDHFMEVLAELHKKSH